MSGNTQLALSFEEGLTAKHRVLEDCVQSIVLSSRLGVDGVAAKMDMAPSELSRRLNAHHAVKEGDSNNRPLRVADMTAIIEIVDNNNPIYWLIEKRLRDPRAQQEAALQQLAALAPLFVGLAEQAGVTLSKAKAGRR